MCKIINKGSLENSLNRYKSTRYEIGKSMTQLSCRIKRVGAIVERSLSLLQKPQLTCTMAISPVGDIVSIESVQQNGMYHRPTKVRNN